MTPSLDSIAGRVTPRFVPSDPAPRPVSPLDGPTVAERRPAGRPGDDGWIGRVIGGKYVVESVLGRGGMGLVLAARHLRLDEPVAIKVLHRSASADPTMTARLLREARAALRLQNDHTVRLLDVDALDDGAPYLVLELLNGVDLATLMKRRGAPFSAEQAVAIADQMCRALAEAHALGIVHRDVKPANLFVVTRPDGRRIVKLLDFGVSRLTRTDEIPVTRPGDIVGSPRYISPEQVLARPVDGRSDIYSAGVVLYEMLSGDVPFKSTNFARMCKEVVKDPPTPLSVHRPDLPAGLVAVVARCLSKSPADRFPDAAQLREALAPFGPVSLRNATHSALPDIGAVLDEAPVSRVQPARSGAADEEDAHDSTTLVRTPANSAPPPANSAPPPASTGAPSDDSLIASLSEGGATAQTGTLATGVRAKRSFLPMALAGLAVGVAIGLGVLAWRSPSPPVDSPARAPSAQPVATARSLPSESPIVLPSAPADVEPTLDPTPVRSARAPGTAAPTQALSAKAKPQAPADPFRQQRH